jgi:Glycosyltransferases involved in cell wall biogenesis
MTQDTTNMTGSRAVPPHDDQRRSARPPAVAVLIPCLNEELTIGAVVASYRRELPDATVYVFDNRSTDRTASIARDAGAVVIPEPRPGKGYVVQAMFQRIEADIYVMVDGDGTYPSELVHALIAPVASGEADMVVGSRLLEGSNSQFKVLNRWGNLFFLWLVRLVFGVKITDMLSGYRAFSRRFVKRLPLLGGGFETETELTIKALDRGFVLQEIPVSLVPRPEGSFSKIRIGGDGVRIVAMIFGMLRDYKPLTFFGGIGLLAIVLGLIPGAIVVVEFIRTRYITHVPSAVLAVGMELFGAVLVAIGLILHTVVRHSQELNVRLQLMTDEIVHRARGVVD